LELLELTNLHHDRAFVPFIYSDDDPRQNNTFQSTIERYKQLEAIEDLPTAFYYEKMIEAFPDALFILTIRDTDEWYKSFLAHHELMIQRFGGALPFRLRDLTEKVYGSATPNEAVWKAHYDAHNSRIIASLPAHQLLVMDITAGDGWNMLCPFLGLQRGPCSPASNEAFPHVVPFDSQVSPDWDACFKQE